MNTTAPSPNQRTPKNAAPFARVGPVLRDVVIVSILTFIGGVIAGVATGGPQRDPQRFIFAVMISNLLLGTVGFTIAGCLAPPARWRHLGLVALGAWFVGLINVAFFGTRVLQWIEGAIFLAVMMGIGGAISYAFIPKSGPKAA